LVSDPAFPQRAAAERAILRGDDWVDDAALSPDRYAKPARGGRTGVVWLATNWTRLRLWPRRPTGRGCGYGRGAGPDADAAMTATTDRTRLRLWLQPPARRPAGPPARRPAGPPVSVADSLARLLVLVHAAGALRTTLQAGRRSRPGARVITGTGPAPRRRWWWRKG
jgi:hypothetical protein